MKKIRIWIILFYKIIIVHFSSLHSWVALNQSITNLASDSKEKWDDADVRAENSFVSLERLCMMNANWLAY